MVVLAIKGLIVAIVSWFLKLHQVWFWSYSTASSNTFALLHFWIPRSTKHHTTAVAEKANYNEKDPRICVFNDLIIMVVNLKLIRNKWASQSLYRVHYIANLQSVWAYGWWMPSKQYWVSALTIGKQRVLQSIWLGKQVIDIGTQHLDWSVGFVGLCKTFTT